MKKISLPKLRGFRAKEKEKQRDRLEKNLKAELISQL